MDSDATLQSTLKDYQEKFCNKKCLLELNYKKMKDVVVIFSETDLHHLLGFHYVLPKKIHANKSIEMVKNNELLINPGGYTFGPYADLAHGEYILSILTPI